MKKKLAILFTFSCMIGTVSAQSLKPMQSAMECGQMLFKHPSTYSFTVRNTSQQPTQIKSIDTGCGCTKATYPEMMIPAGESITVSLTFDGKQLGHFARNIRIYDTSSDTPAEIEVRGQVVTKLENYSGTYPYKMGALLADVEEIEFDNVNKGQHFVQEIHIMNPTGQNVQPTALRLPSYLKAEMHPEVLGPKQSGTMFITLNSGDLRDYGLTQTTIYLGKDPSDKVNEDKEITVSSILLPHKMAKDDVARPYAPKLQMSSLTVDMTGLSKKSKSKQEITLTNTGHSTLEISKLQLFSAGIQVQLDNKTIKPGASTRLKVTGIAKELKKVRTRPRILMITNDPDNQKVVITIKK